MEVVRTVEGKLPGKHAPSSVVAPIDNAAWANPSILEEGVVVGDFGQSYTIASPPLGYRPGTAIHYLPPEARFEKRWGLAADIWTLACAIFEMRAGFPLFEPFLSNDTDILKQTVETLGRLPDPWRTQFDETRRSEWPEDYGKPKNLEARQSAEVSLTASSRSIRDHVRSIGHPPSGEDSEPYIDDGPLMEKHGATLDEDEINLLSDLLERMLKYCPDERISAHEVLNHPWFTN